MFTGNEDHRISLEVAAALTRTYRLLSGPFAVKGEYFSKASIQAILDQDASVGIRIYYGSSALLGPKMVIVGVKANGDDITDGYIAEMGTLCPPVCGSPNVLNSDL